MLDIEKVRTIRNYTPKEYLLRISWSIANILFKLTPKPLHWVRVGILISFGAKVGKQVVIYPSVDVQFPWNLEIGDFVAIGRGVKLYNLGKLSIGHKTTISQYTHVCGGSHSYKDGSMNLLKGEISIGNSCWIAADCFIGPDVTIGDNIVVGARSVVVRSITDPGLYAGHPCSFRSE